VSSDKPVFAVLGAGHGGKAMAADLAVRGFKVRLFNRTFAHIEAIKARGGIELETEDGIHRFGELEVASSDMGEVLAGADVIMVVVPATGHRDMAAFCAPHLQDGQIVVLNLAALPATDTPKVIAALQPAFPQFIPAKNVLHTSLNNMGAVFHPALAVLNSARIESTQGNFEFYMEGVTPTVARVLEAVDRERVTVAAALGIRAQTALEWLEKAYAAVGENLYEAIQANPGYRGVKAPRSLAHRYISEDVPMSLVPIAALGDRFGVSTRAIDSIIRLASILHRTDYYHRGRTLDKLGLDKLSVSEITHYVEEGTLRA